MTTPTSLFTGPLLATAARDAFIKLDPRTLVRNPVMFVTAIVAALSSVLLIKGALGGGADLGFQAQLVFWLWLTVLFGNFAEAMAEGRGKAQAASLRSTKADLVAKRINPKGGHDIVPATLLQIGDCVLVETGDLIPADGEVIEGVASVNEAAITGESAPVIREAGGDRSAVTAGTRVIADCVTVRVTAAQGQGFLDRMIALVEGASRQKTPNEIALTILLAGLTLIFLIAVGTLPAFAAYAGGAIAVPVLVALFVTLIPTTIAPCFSVIPAASEPAAAANPEIPAFAAPISQPFNVAFIPPSKCFQFRQLCEQYRHTKCSPASSCKASTVRRPQFGQGKVGIDFQIKAAVRKMAKRMRNTAKPAKGLKQVATPSGPFWCASAKPADPRQTA
jgi:high-affinity K+ transport system ATPase subunit B